jgi:peptide/nickel transport system substrate-binding protein
MRNAALVAALASAALAIGACGDGEDEDDAPGEDRRTEGGTLTYALAAEPDELDPLYARDRSSQVVARQIHEPLTASLSGPYGDVRELPGLAPLAGSSNDESVWRFRLRPRVRFQDGRPLNASAVLANAERWIATPEGRQLVPGLLTVDAPRPDLVRFILDGPDPAFPEVLDDPRLGLVSPRALRGGEGAVARLKPKAAMAGSGTGAFELREPASEGPVVLARNADWWGTRFDLGPALDQLVFPVLGDGERRVAALTEGTAEVADALGEAEVREVRADPLLAVTGRGGGPVIGFERSVRGIGPGGAVPSLSDAWLTTIGVG